MAYEPGAFCWVGLANSDLVNATAFYAPLRLAQRGAARWRVRCRHVAPPLGQGG